MIKGKNQHVMPCDSAWCVVDESNQMVVKHFNTREEALAFAQGQAANCESGVLLHETASEPDSMSTVPLPQREFNRGKGSMSAPENAAPAPDFDTLVNLDELYFDI